MFEKLKLTPLYGLILPVYHQIELYHWDRKNQKTLTPHLIKQRTVREYAQKYGINVFVETGTYLGTMVMNMRNTFDKIYSIELDDRLYSYCKNKFKNYKNIKIIHGDSSQELPKIIKLLKFPTLFWLDAHYSSGITAGSDDANPLFKEVRSILGHKVKGHIILIDDAYAFERPTAVPSLKNLKDFIRKNYSSWALEVKDDIIRIYQKNSISKSHGKA